MTEKASIRITHGGWLAIKQMFSAEHNKYVGVPVGIVCKSIDQCLEESPDADHYMPIYWDKNDIFIKTEKE